MSFLSRLRVRRNSTGSTYTRSRLNLIEGTNVTLTVADDSVDNEVDVTINAAGGGNVATDTVWDAKGDLVVATANDTAQRIGVGADGQVLTADSAQASGIKWEDAGGTAETTQVASVTGTLVELNTLDGSVRRVTLENSPIEVRLIPGSTASDYDTFTDTNGTALTSHTSDSGRGWGTAFGDMEINSNRVDATTGSSNALMTGAGHADFVASMIVNLGDDGATRACAIRFRYNDNENFLFGKLYRGSTGTNKVEFWKRDASPTAVLISESTIGSGDLVANTEHTFTIKAVGSDVRFYVDGVEKHTETETLHQAETGIGITFEGSINTGQYIDDFRVFPANKADSMTVFLHQDGTGSRTVTWPGSAKWDAGTAPTLSTAASAIDVLTFQTDDSGVTWYGFLAGKGMA